MQKKIQQLDRLWQLQDESALHNSLVSVLAICPKSTVFLPLSFGASLLTFIRQARSQHTVQKILSWQTWWHQPVIPAHEIKAQDHQFQANLNSTKTKCKRKKEVEEEEDGGEGVSLQEALLDTLRSQFLTAYTLVFSDGVEPNPSATALWDTHYCCGSQPFINSLACRKHPKYI